MAKNNQKCVRISDEVLKIVENQDGKGFNEKFENLVLSLNNTIKDRAMELRLLNYDIEEKTKGLNILKAEISEKQRDMNKIDEFKFAFDKFFEKLNT